MRYYCSHFDINYIGHSMSLYQSLLTHGGDFTIFFFCMDDETLEYLEKKSLKNAVLIPGAKLENVIPELKQAKANRTRVEYFFTCSPATCFYVLDQYPAVDLITYVDSDLYFFSSPEPVFEELGNASVGIIHHRFNWATQRNIIYGEYNVGWINFRRDKNGLACLADWLKNCINWCYRVVEPERYADQKYLNFWTTQYANVHVIQHKGANMAIWNIGNYRLRLKNNRVLVDNEPLVFYHFANLRQLSTKTFTTDLSRVFVRKTKLIHDYIYLPYIKSLVSYQTREIIAKKESYNNILAYIVKGITRSVRKLLFPDTITLG